MLSENVTDVVFFRRSGLTDLRMDAAAFSAVCGGAVVAVVAGFAE